MRWYQNNCVCMRHGKIQMAANDQADKTFASIRQTNDS